MTIFKFYKKPAFTAAKSSEVLQKLQKTNDAVISLETELCYYVELCDGEKLGDDERKVLKWVLQNPFASKDLTETENLKVKTSGDVLIEVKRIKDVICCEVS